MLECLSQRQNKSESCKIYRLLLLVLAGLLPLLEVLRHLLRLLRLHLGDQLIDARHRQSELGCQRGDA